MEKELVELYDAAKKAADSCSSGDGEHDESRCIDALEQLRKFPVNYKILVNTQVGKHLKVLTKHPRQKIRAFATDLIEIWKGIIIKETSKNKNGGCDNKVESANGERAKAGKMQKSPSVKVEKSETVKVEKIDRNGTSKSTLDNIKKVQNVDVKTEKTDRAASIKVEKPVSGAKKISSSSAIPPKLKTMIKSNDSVRDKIRELLQEALAKVSGEADEDMLEEVNACDPIRVAVTVESVLFEKWGPSNGAQKVKYRSLMFNLKDQNNPDFRRKVLLGVVEPERLVNMSTAEMASEQRKQENEKIKEKALFECERGTQPKATTDQFKCGRCGQRKCTYYQMQTRSADEPMTTYVTCVVCNNRWKFC
ncbi:transcription elongation factor TFIIS [Abrus precatorius]|uniref:Transcription elongation factor n=1 Tax=Abrus precatorius TaxID=3816 RepID=A0A8B8MJT4_ABRPR|nr:transcription elongation factor TFIIS [Abrus precatorius]XP_027368175.1 transcription elongation factor TFIIS [Abrus precatorius]